MTKVKGEKSFLVYWISSKWRESFHGFVSSVLKVLPLLKAFVEKTFAIHRKATKLFSREAFVGYGK